MADGRPGTCGAGSSSDPLGEVIEERFTDDLVRGVVAHRRADRHVREPARPLADPEPMLPLPPRRQRHRRVAGARRRHGGGHGRAGPGSRRRRRGGDHRRRGEPHRRLGADGAEVVWDDGERPAGRRGPDWVLSGVAPWVLKILLGEEHDEAKPAGSQLKINFLLSRLPRLRSGRRPRAGVRRHLPRRRGVQPVETAYAEAAAGRSRPPRPGSSTATPSPTPPSSAVSRRRGCTR